jgi:UDP-glucuronate decarboxylase
VTGPINIGNPNEMSVKELAEAVIAKIGADAELQLCELPSDDPKQRQPDISRARETLGWEPRVNLDDGLTRTIEHFRNLLASLGAPATA